MRFLFTLRMGAAYRGDNGMETTEQQTAVEDLLQHAGWLRNLAGTLVGDSGADDLVQEAYLAAMRTPPDKERPAKPWLARVTRNAAKMRFRGDGRREQRESATADLIAQPESPADSAERVELQKMLCELVLALPEP
ncbi:MAG: sigma-70 family RNA polymerase sigma factor [Myxococcales bacterium]|nr:sigma-70 family RNA polymerase sigma factor [Myxococcales bacterium]